MNLWRVCTAPQISLGDILYLCHIPCRAKDSDGCSFYWADGLMVISSLVFPPISILSTALSFNFLQLALEEGSHLLWIIPSSDWNVITQTCSRVNTGIRKWSRQITVRWQKQRHPLELNVFDAYETIHIQEKAMKHTHKLKGMKVKQTWKLNILTSSMLKNRKENWNPKALKSQQLSMTVRKKLKEPAKTPLGAK